MAALVVALTAVIDDVIDAAAPAFLAMLVIGAVHHSVVHQFPAVGFWHVFLLLQLLAVARIVLSGGRRDK